MAKLLEDMNMNEATEEVAVQLAAQGVIGKRVDEMESGFLMALDYTIQLVEKDQDDKHKSLLEVIKETVLLHLTKKCPPHVQVVGLLCRTPQKESRHELLRRVAAGDGVFQVENAIVFIQHSLIFDQYSRRGQKKIQQEELFIYISARLRRSAAFSEQLTTAVMQQSFN